MYKENVKDCAEILHNIINQPLSIPGASENVTLLSAAKNYRESDAENSDLHKILLTLHEYPGPTKTLITELEILMTELKK
jgi:hypothetical protein